MMAFLIVILAACGGEQTTSNTPKDSGGTSTEKPTESKDHCSN